MYYDFTRDELGTVRAIIKKEMTAMGYTPKSRYPGRFPGRYHPKNKFEWPRRLKRLATILNKLDDRIKNYDLMY